MTKILPPAHPDAPTKVDKETDKWPVAEEFQQHLRQIKKTHCAQPLRVYLNDKFVKPNDVNGVLANCLAEIHFSIKHYTFHREGEVAHNSFNANVEQIIVLKRGEPKTQTPYKRANPRSGPLNVKRLKTSPEDNSTSGSGEKATSPPLT